MKTLKTIIIAITMLISFDAVSQTFKIQKYFTVNGKDTVESTPLMTHITCIDKKNTRKLRLIMKNNDYNVKVRTGILLVMSSELEEYWKPITEHCVSKSLGFVKVYRDTENWIMNIEIDRNKDGIAEEIFYCQDFF